MTRRAISALLAVLAWAGSCALADIVYMKDGKTHQGQVTREGDTLRIKLAMGEIRVSAADVAFIDDKADPPPSDPAPAPSGEPTSPPGEPGAAGFSADKADRPEVQVFLLMRNQAGVAPGPASLELRKQIETWQGVVHDRKRKVNGQWMEPEDFIRCRAAYTELVSEAEALLRTAKESTSDTEKVRSDKRRNRAAAMGKLMQAAKTWPDASLRMFLLGVVAYQTRNYTQAEGYFRLARQACPHVAGFAQGHGLALLEINRETDALAAFMEVLQLDPASPEALRLLREAMRRTPGTDVRHPTYVRAKALLETYEPAKTTSYTRPGIDWIMPGRKDWYVREDSLPIPTFDRLTVRQAVAVPITGNLLLVDEGITQGADEIYIRINADTLVPAKAKKIAVSGKPAKPIPLAALAVEGYEFTPAVEPNLSTPVAPQDRLTAQAVGVFEAMGPDVRSIPLTVLSLSPQGEMKLSAGLAPGESAAPLLTADGKFAGFLAGRTNAMEAGGGPGEVFSLAELTPILSRIVKSSSSRTASYGGITGLGGSTRRTVTTRPAEGRTFVVLTVTGELMKK